MKTALILNILNIILPLSIGINSLFAQSRVFVNDDNVAIDGYDLVSYYENKAPFKGLNEYSTAHEGVDYHFVSRENKMLFEKSPEKYLPKYGGFCAFGLAKTGKTFPVDPTSYKIIDGELYFFFVGPVQGKITDTRELWNLNEKELIIAAEKAWDNY